MKVCSKEKSTEKCCQNSILLPNVAYKFKNWGKELLLVSSKRRQIIHVISAILNSSQNPPLTLWSRNVVGALNFMLSMWGYEYHDYPSRCACPNLSLGIYNDPFHSYKCPSFDKQNTWLSYKGLAL